VSRLPTGKEIRDPSITQRVHEKSLLLSLWCTEDRKILLWKVATQIDHIATKNKICVAKYAKNCYTFFEPYFHPWLRLTIKEIRYINHFKTFVSKLVQKSFGTFLKLLWNYQTIRLSVSSGARSTCRAIVWGSVPGVRTFVDDCDNSY